mmetsp:Transcript_83686/g.236195  ORF Transcript_83686/g.236195 Transcript_83686/m.236195 type:complete len:211 (+) Transcript_83686:275-907(+)
MTRSIGNRSSRMARRKVSKKKIRFTEEGFDLDLTHITPRIIAMGYPSTGSEALYRNPASEVLDYFESAYAGHYKVLYQGLACCGQQPSLSEPPAAGRPNRPDRPNHPTRQSSTICARSASTTPLHSTGAWRTSRSTITTRPRCHSSRSAARTFMRGWRPTRKTWWQFTARRERGARARSSLPTSSTRGSSRTRRRGWLSSVVSVRRTARA